MFPYAFYLKQPTFGLCQYFLRTAKNLDELFDASIPQKWDALQGK